MAGRREILIDAYNVIYADPRLGPLVRRDAERAREEFLALVAQRVPADGSSAFVVFDAMRDPRPVTETGRTNKEYTRGLHVVYARESADTWIRERIQNATEPALITIVTSDREILETARAHGTGVLRVSDFLQLAARRHARTREIRDTKKPGHTSRREIEEWERLFGEPREDE
jgi:predicted RNA-binding protein with PIN domain